MNSALLKYAHNVIFYVSKCFLGHTNLSNCFTDAPMKNRENWNKIKIDKIHIFIIFVARWVIFVISLNKNHKLLSFQLLKNNFRPGNQESA